MGRTLIEIDGQGKAETGSASVSTRFFFTCRQYCQAIQLVLLLLFSASAQASISCPSDTSQADFQQGTPYNVVLTGGGDVKLASASSIDQQNTSLTASGFHFHSYWWVAQTFTAGVSGPLTQVDLRLFCNACTGTTPDILVSIRATSGGIPTGNDLATAVIPGFSSAGGGWFQAVFASPMQMNSGTQYAILVRAVENLSAGTYAYLVSADSSAYSGGQRLTSTNNALSFEPREYDIGFKVYSGSGFVAAGNLISSLKDSNPPPGTNPVWTNLSWNGSTPSDTTLKFQAAASDSPTGPFTFVGPNGTAGTYFTSSGDSLSQFDGKRYLKYRSYLSSSSSSKTPTLEDVTVCHDHMGTDADLQISKTNGVGVSTPGDNVSYTIVASNAGPSLVDNATVTDTFGPDLQNCSWTCSGSAGGACPASGNGNINQLVNLPPGASTTFIASCTIKASATGSLANTATIGSPKPDPVPGNNSATDTDALVASANLGITKTNGVNTSTPGSQTSYTIVASNAGPSNVNSATVTDTFNSNLENCSWTCSGAGGGTCPATGNGNINQAVNLPSGASATFIASCGVKSSATGSLVNTATISSSTTDPVPGNNSATDTDTLAASADLGITKTNGVSSSTPGGQTSYTIVASNAGPSNVSNATVTDSFNSNLENCSWTCLAAGGGNCAASGSGNINQSVNLPSGASATFVASCDIKSSAIGSLVNTATISSATADPVAANNSATDTDSLGASADLAISKSNGVSSSTPGGQTSYTIVASNAGPSNVSNATVTDSFNSNLENCSWTCSGAAGGSCAASGSGDINQAVNLPSGASATFVASCNIKSSATGSLVNTATIASATSDPVPDNNSATDTDSLGGSADLAITKTNGVSSSTPGAQTSYTIVASNAGPSNVSNATVTDTFSANHENCSWTCSASGGGSCAASGSGNINQSVNLPSGASTTFIANCGVKSSATGSLFNTATISSATVDPVPANNSATDTDTLSASANLGITKTNGVSSYTPGGNVSYTIVASNAGPSNVISATVTDIFTSNLQNCSWTCSGAGGGSCTASGSGNISQLVNLPAGGSTTFIANCGVKSTATGSLVNTATISSTTTDPVAGNNSATDTDTLSASADLGITKTDGVSAATPGGNVSYTIVASNAGPSNVSSVTVTDNFSSNHQNCSWTCSGSGGGSCAASGSGNISQVVNLPSGASTTFIASCGVKPSATGSLVNTATVSSATPDPNSANNSATDTDSLGGSADLRITNSNEVSTVVAGESVIYTITASNVGPSSVSNATVTDTFPAKLSNCQWLCNASGGGSCAAAGFGNINHAVNLPVGASAEFTAICDVTASATGSLVNTAAIASATSDPVPANNTVTDTDTINLVADLGISMTDGVSTVKPGKSVTYTIVASNAGVSSVSNVSVVDNFPPELNSCNWTCSGSGGGSCPASGSGNINRQVTLPVGASVSFSATCQVSGTANTAIVNTATVSGPVSDPVSSNNTATDTNQLNTGDQLIFKSGFD